MTENDSRVYLKSIWKGKIPPKIQFFMWLLSNRVVLTKDNLIRKNWVGSPECYFCNDDETIDHLFFKCFVTKVVWVCIAKFLGANDIHGCLEKCWQWLDTWLPHGKLVHVTGVAAICWSIWCARNKACFDKKIIKNPLEIICHAGALVKFWACLYQEMDMEAIEKGVDHML